MSGKQLIDRMEDMETRRVLDTLDGLMSIGLRPREQGQRPTMRRRRSAHLPSQSGSARDLRDAVYPSRGRKRGNRPARAAQLNFE